MPVPRFVRSKQHAVLGGVCAGLAIYFDIDVVLVRVLTVALTLVTGVAALAYLILVLATPSGQAIPR